MHNGEKLASSSSMKEMNIGAISEKDEGKTVTIAGWIHSLREIGTISFLTLRDSSGKIQVKLSKSLKFSKPNKSNNKSEEELEREKEGESVELVGESTELDRESAVQMCGKVRKDARAPNGIELEAQSVKVLGKIYQLPPFYPLQKNEPNLNVRLDNRSLDLRGERTRAIFNIRAALESGFRDAVIALNFEEINPACIVSSSTEGGAQLFKIDYFDRPAFLAQSPQFYKQLAVIGGMERVFMTMPVFRAEKHEGPFHINEIHQMDIEIAFADDGDAIALLSEVFLHMLGSVKENNENDLNSLNVKMNVPNKASLYTYSDLVETLSANGEKITWGEDFSREHEMKICEFAKNDVVIVKDYPTAMRAFYSMPYKDNPKICKAYDLIYKGLEVASGAQRIHVPELLKKQALAKGMDLESQSLASYISAFNYGAPPHAGWSMGLDRITMQVCGLDNIREAVMFPRDKQRVKP